MNEFSGSEFYYISKADEKVMLRNRHNRIAHYPTLDTYLSLSFHSDTLPEYLPYPTNRRKSIPPYIEYLSHLPNPRHVRLHTCTHLILPFISYPNLHFPTLYYCQGLIK